MRGNVVRARPFVVGASVLSLAGAVAVAAGTAGAQVQVNAMFSGGGGSAAWVTGVDAPGDADGQAIKLSVPGPGGYAGADLFDAPSAPPTAAPSFKFESTVSGSAQASPRLVIAFSDGDNIELAPTSWTANTWTTVSGAAGGWTDAGHGACKPLSSVSYQQALACHLADGASVTDLYVVSDASYPGGFVNYVDDIAYAGTTITSQGIVSGATSPRVTHFASRASVATGTGKGTFQAGCRTSAGDHCRFALKLTTKVAGKSVSIGKVEGIVSGTATSNLVVLLNARGRSLLLAHEGKLSATASGTVTDDSGFSVAFGPRHLTLKAS